MSFREGIYKPLNGINFSDKTEEEIQYLYKDVLNDGIHGICFSAYEEGQKPGDILTEEQVRRRLNILRPYTQWIRSFSTTEGNELIPIIAKEMGMNTLVGAWLGDDFEKNEAELKNLIQLSKDGFVDIAAVGNEVLYRKDLTEEELLEYIYRAKEAIPSDIPVGYVDAYYEFTIKPEITAACDVILANCYPYWEECAHDYSLVYMKQMYNQAKAAGRGKKVIITETGWPSKGKGLGDAVPSEMNAIKYFINAQMWSKDEDIPMFYFSSFDESWKVGPEGDVGAHWGLWDKNEEPKFQSNLTITPKKAY